MVKKTYEHGVDRDRARDLVAREASRYAKKYGLSSSWRGDTWTGKRWGVKVVARVTARKIAVEVDATFGEKKILKAIDGKLRQRLGG